MISFLMIFLYFPNGGKSFTDLPIVWRNLKVNGNKCFEKSIAKSSGFICEFICCKCGNPKIKRKNALNYHECWKRFFTSLHDREGKALLHISWFSIINCLVFTGINDVFVVANEDLPKIISLMRIRLLPVRTEFRFFLLHFSY